MVLASLGGALALGLLPDLVKAVPGVGSSVWWMLLCLVVGVLTLAFFSDALRHREGAGIVLYMPQGPGGDRSRLELMKADARRKHSTCFTVDVEEMLRGVTVADRTGLASRVMQARLAEETEGQGAPQSVPATGSSATVPPSAAITHTGWGVRLTRRPVRNGLIAPTLLEGVGADHHAQHKPYSVSPLMAAGRPGTAVLRIGWLQDSPRPDLTALTGLRVRLGAQFFTVGEAEEEFTPYPALCRVPGARRVVMRFVSATYFSRNGRWHPLPDPVLLYGGLIRRWNLFAPPYARIDEAQEKALLSSVALSAHDIASCPVDPGAGSRVGFTGDAAFTLVGPHADGADGSAGLLAGLSLFAAASGVGAQTTHGLGCVDVGLE